MSFIIRTVEPYTVRGPFVTRSDAEKALDVAEFDPAPYIDPALCAVYRVSNDSRTTAELERDEAIRERDELLPRIAELEARLRDNRAQVRDVYRVEVDAVVYWVSARSHSEAMGLCVLTSAGVLPVDVVPNEVTSKYGSTCVDWGTFKVLRVSEAKARATALNCEEVGDTDMWTEHLRLDQPDVLGCSEWP